MKRLFRILSNTLTALSLRLFLAKIVLWVRSYQANHLVQWWRVKHESRVVSTTLSVVRGGASWHREEYD